MVKRMHTIEIFCLILRWLWVEDHQRLCVLPLWLKKKFFTYLIRF